MTQPASTRRESACCSPAGSFEMSAPMSVGAYCAAAASSFACSGTTTSLAGAVVVVGDTHAAAIRTSSDPSAINDLIGSLFGGNDGGGPS